MLVFGHMRVSGERVTMAMIGACLAAGMAAGQPNAGAARFTSASVRIVPQSPDEFRAVLGTAIQGEVRLTDATLLECLRFAFGITNDFQIVGPDWLRSGEYRFNINGKAPADTPFPQLRLMLQNLLAERFQMTLHSERRELSFLTLEVSKKGLKLEPARDGSDATGNRQVLGKIYSNSLSITQLSTLLARFLEQPVLDLTGLAGWFDVKLDWTPPVAPAPDDAAAAAAIATALEQQLGLTLEPRKGPLEVIVVDRAERKPIGN